MGKKSKIKVLVVGFLLYLAQSINVQAQEQLTDLSPAEQAGKVIQFCQILEDFVKENDFVKITGVEYLGSLIDPLTGSKDTIPTLWIDQSFWEQIIFSQKRILVFTLAVCGTKQVNSGLFLVYVRDLRTGEKLARWTPQGGFKLYDNTD